eukprot:m.216643 g.216643  ORF g.216643 m.216643 type:complete len:331 (+) comp19115_c0_seq28:2525-3517(+)
MHAAGHTNCRRGARCTCGLVSAASRPVDHPHSLGCGARQQPLDAVHPHLARCHGVFLHEVRALRGVNCKAVAHAELGPARGGVEERGSVEGYLALEHPHGVVHVVPQHALFHFYNMPASFPRFALLPSLQQPATRGTADDARAQTLSCRRNVSVLRPRDTRPDADRAVVRVNGCIIFFSCFVYGCACFMCGGDVLADGALRDDLCIHPQSVVGLARLAERAGKIKMQRAHVVVPHVQRHEPDVHGSAVVPHGSRIIPRRRPRPSKAAVGQRGAWVLVPQQSGADRQCAFVVLDRTGAVVHADVQIRDVAAAGCNSGVLRAEELLKYLKRL